MGTTMDCRILAIGDKTEHSEHEKPEILLNIRNFNADFINYLNVLFKETRMPKDVVNGEYAIEWFGMETIKRIDQPTRYQFYCFPSQKTQPKHVNPFYFYQTINANALMRDVRIFLKEEHWLSKYVVIGLLKGKLDGWGYNPEENYIRNAIHMAFNAERLREKQDIFPYLLYLHRQHVKNNLKG
ncbi:uncharacterized protein LOC115483811 [Drosophila hydei]|uniref:Uncharacterized protein LOC115483811 n=1 Tax=Drosophila hydei TaxID=7224 RepID=A0A6J2T1I6_DROHY|nr:uncharacterized protein LOC115483811 [Drosophila hydei]